MNEIYEVVEIGSRLQDRKAKAHANFVHLAKIQKSAETVDVVLKDEVPHRLIKELLAVRLAQQLGVPHLNGWLASVSTRQADEMQLSSRVPRNGRFVVFASEKCAGQPVAPSGGMANQSFVSKYLASPEAVHVLVFDQLIANFDRMYENLMWTGSQFAAFDHDKILFTDTDAWCDLPATSFCDNLISTNVAMLNKGSRSAVWAVANTIASSVGQIDLQDVTEVTSLNFRAEDANCLMKFLRERATVLAALVDKHYA